MPRICVVTYGSPELTETFIRAHVEHLDGETHLLAAKTHDLLSRTPLQQSPFYRFGRKIAREVGWSTIPRERENAYRSIFREMEADVVLAEFGPTAAKVVEACALEDIPLVAHFHGYDVSRRATLEKYQEDYRRVFEVARASVAVSRPMRNRLIELGAPPERVYWNSCGAECDRFRPATFETPNPTFVSVGRFVPKKGPHLTVLAFSRVLEAHPDARLRMIGDDVLLDACRDLAEALGIDHAVTFMGSQPHEIVQQEMQRAWCYVQHSIEAHSGDSEGTPVSIMEAGAAALPVVATRHAGIPDVIVNGRTGFLVDERDIEAMAERMIRIASNRALAQEMGRANLQRVKQHFDVKQRVARLSEIVNLAAGVHSDPLPQVPAWLESMDVELEALPGNELLERVPQGV